jgi:hypothetical protein
VAKNEWSIHHKEKAESLVRAARALCLEAQAFRRSIQHAPLPPMSNQWLYGVQWIADTADGLATSIADEVSGRITVTDNEQVDV